MVEYMEERCSVKTVVIIKNCNRGTLALANCELAIRSKGCKWSCIDITRPYCDIL